MAQLSKRERVDAALKGDFVDRVPVSAWRHFIPDERTPETLARASLKHFHDYDWDWLKVNPRATYYAEAWGNTYDYSTYDGVLPKFIQGPLNSPADLPRIGVVSPVQRVFAEQLDLVGQIKAGIGDAHFLQTVFSPLSVLASLIGPARHTIDEAVQSQVSGLQKYIQEDPKGVHEALKNISRTLAAYSAAAVDAGASGLFYAIVKLARKDVLTQAEYTEFGKPYDLEVLKAVQGAPFNLLHTCGPAVYFNLVADYPVHAINWAAVNQNNPSLSDATLHTNRALAGGIDEAGSLQTGTPEQVIQDASAAIRTVGGRHFLLTPGCGTSLTVPPANLHALRQAADVAITA